MPGGEIAAAELRRRHVAPYLIAEPIDSCSLGHPGANGGEVGAQVAAALLVDVARVDLRREQVPVKIVFTTHATLPGRYLAMAYAAHFIVNSSLLGFLIDMK